jgi:hypothetical protein
VDEWKTGSVECFAEWVASLFVYGIEILKLTKSSFDIPILLSHTRTPLSNVVFIVA